MPQCLTRVTETTSSKVVGYADDTNVYVKSNNVKNLSSELQFLANNMVNFCNKNGLILNAQKIQILTTARETIQLKINQDMVSSCPTISLLGLEYDTNLSTAPYLRQLARESNTRVALIRRLSYGMPHCLLKPLANGLLMDKILAAAPAAIPIKIYPNDKPYLTGILNDIDRSIKATARIITRTKLTDKVRSEITLWRAGLRSLNEAVSMTMASSIWKARKDMNTLGCIFESKDSVKNTRSVTRLNLCQPVPGHPEVAANKLAQIWNLLNLSSAKTLSSAKASVHQWYKKNPCETK